MADIGQLVVRIGADASELKKALEDIEQGGNKASKGIATAGKIMAGAFLAAASAAVYLTVQAGKQAEELDKLSQITGIGTDQLQGYEVAMNRVGLTGDDMSRMMKTLSKNLEEAQQGTGEASDRFRQLGIDITKVTSTDDLIRKVMNSVSRFADGTEKAAIVGQLLGKSGLAWIPAMKDGAKALDDAAEKARKMGQLSQDQIAVLTKMDDAFDDLAMASKFFAGNLGALLAPAIQYVVELLTDFVSWLNQGLKSMRELLGLTGQETAGAKGGAAPPKMVDSGKAQAATQGLLDARIKANQQSFANAKTIEQAELALFQATMDNKRQLFQRTELDIAKTEQDAQEAHTAFTIKNAELELANYQKYAEARKATFTKSDKDIAAAAKFGTEAAAEEEKLKNNILIAQIEGKTAAVKANTKVQLAAQAEEIQGVQDEIDRYEALNEIQSAYVERLGPLFGSVESLRRIRVAKIEEEADLERKLLNTKIMTAERYAQKMEDIDNREQARKMKVAEELPTFWEKQLNDLTASNQFSMALLVNQWTSALATIIVKGGDFKSVIEATEIAVVQAFINMGVQMAAQAVKAALVQEAAASTTAISWEGAAAAITGTFATIGAAITGFWSSVLLPMFVAVGEALMTFLSAIAEALSATVFGIPYAGAILVGVAIIAGAVAALTAVKFAKGGVVTGPTLGMLGEAGPEAVIPLDRAGGMFGGSDRPIINKIYIDGKYSMRALSKHQTSAWRWEGAPA